jgi:hypothetical protein
MEFGRAAKVDIVEIILYWSEANFGESNIFVIEGRIGSISLINWMI